MDRPLDASKISEVSVSNTDAEAQGAACSLGEEIDLMVCLTVRHEDSQVRRVAGAFARALVGSLAAQRFGGAYFFVCDAAGKEIPDQPLDTSPLFVGIRAMGAQEPTSELLGEISKGLEGMVKRIMADAGLDGDIEVVRPSL